MGFLSIVLRGNEFLKRYFQDNLRVERLNLDGVDVTDDAIQHVVEMLIDNITIAHVVHREIFSILVDLIIKRLHLTIWIDFLIYRGIFFMTYI